MNFTDEQITELLRHCTDPGVDAILRTIRQRIRGNNPFRCASCGVSSFITEVKAIPGSTFYLCAGCLKGESER